MGKLIGIDEAAELARQLRSQGRKVALANGAFDPLHVGHVRYLKAAKDCADILIVAVNSDGSVRGLKGEGRPVLPQDERVEILCALEPVDYVLIFEEPTVEKVILALRPDYHCKGTDYTPDSVPEADLVRSLGGEVRIVGDTKDHDSSAMIRKIREGGAGKR
jgi:rfaE bifunctional protein nucleotidyltransferase chain/domain